MSDIYRDAMERVCKWRALFAGWQLGTRAKGDPESDAVRDHRELTIMLRADVNALTTILIRKGVFSAEEFTRQMAEECEHLNAAYEKRFPGVKADLDGLVLSMPEVMNTMRGWKP